MTSKRIQSWQGSNIALRESRRLYSHLSAQYTDDELRMKVIEIKEKERNT